MRVLLASLCLSLTSLTPALAQDASEPEFQGAHRDWRVFTRGEGEAKVCYALSRPGIVRILPN